MLDTQASSAMGISLLLVALLVTTLVAIETTEAQLQQSGQLDYAKAVSTESIKESIRALYMNMDVPEIGPGDSIGTLNVSLKISSLLKLSNHQLDVAFTLDLRWRHKFLEMLVDTMEAIPLNRQKLWTPQFVFVNVQSLTEDQTSLYLHLTSNSETSKAVVYKVWHRASIRCEGPSIQHPFSDTLCALIFEEANPDNQRSIHMSLTRQHQLNCSRAETRRYKMIYRVSKPFSDDGRKFQFWTRICVRSNLEDMLPAMRQYCLSFIMVLLSITTVYLFDRNTCLFINLALLHILIFNWSPTAQHLNAIDIWNAMCTFIICCCLLAALTKKSRRAARFRRRTTEAINDDPQMILMPRSAKHSYSGTIVYQKDPRSSKCTAISESNDHLDLFGAGDQTKSSRDGSAVDDNGGGSHANSSCRLLAKIILPIWWTLFVTTFWAAVLLTAASCEKLLPECFAAV